MGSRRSNDSWFNEFKRMWYVMEHYIWALSYTALLSFCMWVVYGLGYRRGYRTGGRKILNIWKKTLEENGGNENGKVE